MRASARCAVFGLLGAGSACSLFVSTSDLSTSGGSVDGGETNDGGDAGVQPPDGGQPDADAAASDASWCPADALICDDFERTTALGGWDAVFAGAGGTHEIVPDTPFGRAFVVRVPGASSGIGKAGLHRMRREELGSFLTYRSRLRVTRLPDVGGANLNEVYFHRGTNVRSSVFFSLGSGAITLFEQDCAPDCNAQEAYNLAAFTLGTWHDVVLRVTFGAPTQLEVEIDGALVHSRPSAAGVSPGTVEVTAGINYTTAPHGAAEIQIDDVAVDGR